MEKCLAFVLSGGGSRGAMQVGALRTLLEAGFKPDLLVGSSIGAVNATGLALWGADLAGVEALAQAFQEVANANLMDPRLGRLMLRALSGRPNRHASQRVAEYFISKGISPEFRFDQIAPPRLALIGSNLDAGQPVIYGLDPSQTILEGLLASIAMPPWFAPVEKDGQFIVDGGIVSNLPIEPALTMGATEIIALDLCDPAFFTGNVPGRNPSLDKLAFSITQRQTYLEMALAEARGVAVHYIGLRSLPPTPIWDFSNHQELVQIGYDITMHTISEWRKDD